jgi:hypothetical protein
MSEVTALAYFVAICYLALLVTLVHYCSIGSIVNPVVTIDRLSTAAFADSNELSLETHFVSLQCSQ